VETRAVESGANPSACFAWGYDPSLPRGKNGLKKLKKSTVQTQKGGQNST